MSCNAIKKDGNKCDAQQKLNGYCGRHQNYSAMDRNYVPAKQEDKQKPVVVPGVSKPVVIPKIPKSVKPNPKPDTTQDCA